jgi:hypothetical protein
VEEDDVVYVNLDIPKTSPSPGALTSLIAVSFFVKSSFHKSLEREAKRVKGLITRTACQQHIFLPSKKKKKKKQQQQHIFLYGWSWFDNVLIYVLGFENNFNRGKNYFGKAFFKNEVVVAVMS